MMVVVGWLVSYYVIVLVRGYAESTSCRGMARLACLVETVRRLRMVKAGTWPLFLHSSTANEKLRTARGGSVATDSAFEEVVNHARNTDD